MKFKICFVLTLILFLLMLNGCRNLEKPDVEGYQEAKWGMSKEEIRGLIELPLTDERDERLRYSDVIEGDKVTISYMFDRGKLYMVVILFELPVEHEELSVRRFAKVYHRLARKYGQADVGREEELDKGGLFVTWEFKKSEIFLQLKVEKSSNKLVLALIYEGAEYLDAKGLRGVWKK